MGLLLATKQRDQIRGKLRCVLVRGIAASRGRELAGMIATEERTPAPCSARLLRGCRSALDEASVALRANEKNAQPSIVAVEPQLSSLGSLAPRTTKSWFPSQNLASIRRRSPFSRVNCGNNCSRETNERYTTFVV